MSLPNPIPEVFEKLALIVACSRQIADILQLDKRTVRNAIDLAQLQRRRADLQACLPPLRIVGGTDMEKRTW